MGEQADPLVNKVYAFAYTNFMKTKYTKEVVEKALIDAQSFAEVVRNLGLKNSGGNHRRVKHFIRFYNLSTSSIRGQAWAKGLTYQKSVSIRTNVQKQTKRITDEVFFSQNAPPGAHGAKIKIRLLRLGWKEKCFECGISEWNSKKLDMDVDHINGINNDNRLINLRFLCPNCHKQTETWGNKMRHDGGMADPQRLERCSRKRV